MPTIETSALTLVEATLKGHTSPTKTTSDHYAHWSYQPCSSHVNAGTWQLNSKAEYKHLNWDGTDIYSTSHINRTRSISHEPEQLLIHTTTSSTLPKRADEMRRPHHKLNGICKNEHARHYISMSERRKEHARHYISMSERRKEHARHYISMSERRKEHARHYISMSERRKEHARQMSERR